MSRQILMQFSGVVTGRLFAAAAQALTIVLLARWSAPEVFGLVIAVQTALTAFSVLLSAGIPQYIGVLRARDASSPVIAGIFHWNRRVSVVASATCLVILAVLGASHPIFLLFLPLGLALGFQRNGNVWESIAVADGQIKLFSSNLVLRRVATLLFFTVLHAAEVDVVLGYCCAVLTSQVLYNDRLRRKCLFVPGGRTRTTMRPVFRESKHFWVDSMSGMLRSLDVAAVGVVLGPLAAGYLAVPSKVASPLMLLPTSFATLILPRVSAGRGHTARQGLYLAFGVTTMVALVLGVLAPFLDELIRLALGDSYLPAVTVTRIYFIGFVGLSLIHMMGAVLQGLGLHSAVGRNSGVFSVLTLVLLCGGGHFFGLEAAAWGFAVGTLGQVIGLMYLYVFLFRGTGGHIRQPSGRKLLRTSTEHR